MGLRREEVMVSVARTLGFKSTSSKLRGVIEKTLHGMAEQGAVEAREDKLYAATSSEIRAG